jgi:pentatricopeptide repeat protein
LACWIDGSYAYRLFQSMLASGHSPNDRDVLLKEAVQATSGRAGIAEP